MTRKILATLLLLFRRPRRLILTLVLLVGGVVVGLQLWAWHHLSAGRAALARYQPGAALTHLHSTLAIWPSSTEARLLAARAARRAGDLEEAEQQLDECRRRASSRSADIGLEWALLRAWSGDLAEVEQPLNDRLEKDPANTVLILEALVEGYRRMSRIHQALAYTERWLALRPDDVQAYYLRGEVHLHVGAVKKAVEDYEQVVKRTSDHEQARRRLARCLAQVGRFREGLQHAESLLRTHPDDPELQVAAARCRYLLGDKAQAQEALERVVAAHPDYGPALMELGIVEAAAGRDDAAERWLRRAVRVQPYSYQAVYAFAQCLDRLGQDAEAKVQAEHARQIKNRIERLSEISRRDMTVRPFDPALRIELGRLFLGLGQKEVGARWLYSAVQVAPQDPAAHAALAKYYDEEGDTARAAQHRLQASAVRSQGSGARDQGSGARSQGSGVRDQ